ncbi:GNAT family N-acetyltransferase [Actinoplanes sp. HUAS TT8]|uniref:GNAT family N-acetyltransferase n=1 Tax=Actinoplanes sp. HUAS TT8 TaxID=3447453 RepID=UPI003F51D2CD
MSWLDFTTQSQRTLCHKVDGRDASRCHEAGAGGRPAGAAPWDKRSRWGRGRSRVTIVGELILRAAGPSEVDALLAFWQSAAENDGRPTDTPAAVEALVTRDPEALIVAVADGEIVGTIIAGWDGWRCHLYRLAVSPAHRRQGIGGRLISAAEERFRRLGGTRADAMVLDANERAHGIWSAHGYRRQGEWSRWVKPLT